MTDTTPLPAQILDNTVAAKEVTGALDSLHQTYEEWLRNITSPEFLLNQLIWVAQILMIALLAWLLSSILWRHLRRWMAKSSDEALFRHALPAAATGPLGAFVWLTAVGLMAKVLVHHFGESDAFKFFFDLKPALHIVIISWFFVRLNRAVFRDVLVSRGKLTAAGRDLGQKVGTAIVMAFAALMILPSFGVSVGSVMTVGGIGGIVLGFASKDMLANYVGAIMLHFDQPFQVGDWVRIPERNAEGIVESIGWRQVVVRNFNKEMIYVPNALFGTLVVENPGRMTHRRFKEYMGLRYSDISKVETVVAGIRTYLAVLEGVDQTQPPVVVLERLGAYSVDVLVQFYTPIVDYAGYAELRQKVLLAVAEIVSKAGADFAYPTQVVNLVKEA